MTDTSSAREEVLKCEQEIHSVKAALRRVGTTSTPPDGEQNSMEIVLLKVRITQNHASSRRNPRQCIVLKVL